MIDPDKRSRLERAGFQLGTIKEFLDLTDEELQVIDLMLGVELKLWKALRKALAERDRARQERDAAIDELEDAVNEAVNPPPSMLLEIGVDGAVIV